MAEDCTTRRGMSPIHRRLCFPPVRLWSLHPQYLDRIGLVALWREGLLAQAVLCGKTRGYTRHPQLERFRKHRHPETAIARYLHAVADEADRRGYAFDRTKLPAVARTRSIEVTSGQLGYEWSHLLAKLKVRNPAELRRVRQIADPLPHPSFIIVPGGVAPWERPVS